MEAETVIAVASSVRSFNISWYKRINPDLDSDNPLTEAIIDASSKTPIKFNRRRHVHARMPQFEGGTCGRRCRRKRTGEDKAYFRKLMKDYLKQNLDSTQEGKANLKEWRKRGHSPHDNPSGLCDDCYHPIDFISAMRFWKDFCP